MNINELREQLQEDIMCIMDGENPELINVLCQNIVDRFNQLNQ